MVCKNCGKEIVGNFCSECGMKAVSMSESSHNLPENENQSDKPEFDPVQYLMEQKLKQKRERAKVLKIALPIFFGFFIILIIVGMISEASVKKDIRTAKYKIENKEYSAAKKILDSSLEKDETYEDIYTAYAYYYSAQGNYEDALNILNQGLEKASSTDSINEEIEKINQKYEEENKTEAEEQKKADEATASKAAEDKIAKEEAEKIKKEQYIASCIEISFKDLARNPTNYFYKKLKFTGKVIQVKEISSFGRVAVKINVTKTDPDTWTDAIYGTLSLPSGADRILKDDIITIYGYGSALFSDTNSSGEKESFPEIEIEYYSIQQ